MCEHIQQLFLAYGFCGEEERLPVVAGACREAGIWSLADFDGVRDIRSVPELAGLLPFELSFLEDGGRGNGRCTGGIRACRKYDCRYAQGPYRTALDAMQL